MYKARYCNVGGVDDNDSNYSDTVCGLINFLKLANLNPNNVELYEIYNDREIRIARYMYTKNGDQWLIGKELCQSFKKIYPDHIGSESCWFADRSKAVL